MAQKPRKTRESTSAPSGPAAPASKPGTKAASQAADSAMEQAQRAVDAIRAAADEAPGGLELPDFAQAAGAQPHDPAALSLLRDVNLQVKVELGRTRMYVEDVLRLNENSVIELDKLAGDPVDIYVNDRPVARGEVLVVNDNFCVRVSEIL